VEVRVQAQLSQNNCYVRDQLVALLFCLPRRSLLRVEVVAQPRLCRMQCRILATQRVQPLLQGSLLVPHCF
jgi:hypothetical protein